MSQEQNDESKKRLKPLEESKDEQLALTQTTSSDVAGSQESINEPSIVSVRDGAKNTLALANTFLDGLTNTLLDLAVLDPTFMVNLDDSK